MSSSKLALVLVLMVILFSLAGAVLPQEGMMESKDIASWQQEHPAVTRALEPAGFFHVFHAWPFMVTIILLGINTLTCTALCFQKFGGFSAFRGPQAVERLGFILLHLSIIVLLAGGFFSAATKLDGYIVLTEGQRFTESHKNYLRLVEGPLRPERHQDFVVALKNIRVEHERERYITDVTSNLEILGDGGKVTEGIVKYNKPLTYKGLSFIQAETGFSPRLIISDRESVRTLINSFVALKTFHETGAREYRDFLPLSFFKHTVIVTLYPSFRWENGEPQKTGEDPNNPILRVEMKDDSGKLISYDYVPFKDKVDIGDYSFSFSDLRRWSAFKVVQDSGYPVVWISFWVGMVSLLLRYVPFFRRWFVKDVSAHKAPDR